MVMGVLVPISMIAISEIWLKIKDNLPTEYENYQRYLAAKVPVAKGSDEIKDHSIEENRFGKRMISTGILVIGLIIGFLGLTASYGKIYVLGVAFILLLIGARILFKTLR